ncbi:MAG: DUF91 domain-containing protein [Chloroflexi bacterium]|nr:DUF91 domain-containing protein [Chloroflexota bacterium]
MTSYLIPYLDPKKIEGHDDPLLQEYTYGESGRNRGGMLLNKVKRADFLFFHTNKKGRHVITGYYYVEKSMLTREAKQDELITRKYRNPHLSYSQPSKYDTIVFGNVVYSKALAHPYYITAEIVNKLSSKPKSISRPWIKLQDSDVQLLLSEIKKSEEQGFLKDTLLSSDEVQQLLEEDVESFIETNPKELSRNLRAFRRQHVLKSGKRVDLLLEDGETIVVVEIKKGAIGRETYSQISGYLQEVKDEFKRNVRGIIVCSDVLPLFEDFYLEKIGKDIEVYLYSWKFNLRSLQRD